MEEKSVLFKIKSLEQLILRNLFMKEMTKHINIRKVPSPTQMRIIDYLIQNNTKTIYQKDLEQIMGLRRATISEVLITMEKNNMIERITSEFDTRTKEIKLSEYSKEIFESHKKKLLQLEKTITKNISKEELKTFTSVIAKMKDNIQKLN